MRAVRKLGFIAALSMLLAPLNAHAVITGLTRVASGLNSPLFVTSAPGDSSRLFIVERGSGTSTNATATIKILNLSGPNAGTVNATPFLSIPGVNINGEGGFLGMAFSPNYATDKKFYVYVTAGSLTTTFTSYIRQYAASSNPDVALAAATEVLSWAQPTNTYPNHKGGWIGFSPNDGYLYVSSGDGGGADDNDAGHNSSIGNGQDKNVLLGKMLRIDVNGDDFPGDATKNYKIPSTNPFAGATAGADEVWAYGLRNPFRDSFDRTTGDLWIGDVGQDNREEIDFQLANAAGGANYGWRLREGDIATPTPTGSPVGGATPAGYVAPVYVYTHPGTTVPPVSPTAYAGIVETGGYVYRGPDPSLQGQYFFFDSQNSAGAADDNYWTFNPANPSGTVANINSLLTANTGTHQFPVSFGEDSAGNLYIAYLISGEVYRLATNNLSGDYDHDNDVDSADYTRWRSMIGTTQNFAVDGNHNGVVDAADYVIWRKNTSGAGSGAEVPELASAVYLLQFLPLLALRPMFVRRRK